MSRVTVVGGSGVLGARLVQSLLRNELVGDVTAVSFHRESQAAVARLGCESVRADVRDKMTLYEHLEGRDLVVNVTPSLPVDPARAQFCGEVIKAGLGNVAEVASVMECRNLISVSFLGATEDEANDSFLGAAEETAAEKSSKRLRHYLVQMGEVYSGDSTSIQGAVQGLHAGNAKVVGEGSNTKCLIHADDAAVALRVMSEDMLTNSYPVTPANHFKKFPLATHCLSFKDFLGIAADVVGAPPPKAIPALMAPVVFRGQPDMLRYLSVSQQADMEPFSRAFPKFSPQFNTFEDGMRQVAAFWSTARQKIVNEID